MNIDEKTYDLLFIKKTLEQYTCYFESQKRGATIKGIPAEVVKEVKIPKAPICIQKQFVEFVHQSDKSKFMILKMTLYNEWRNNCVQRK